MSWSYAYTPYIWPMLASAIFMAGLAVYAWKHRTVPGAGPFAVQMWFSALWAGFAAIEMAAMAEPTRVFWFKLERMMAPPTMTALLFFALEYANSGKWMSRRKALVLSAPALFATALMATNDLYHLFWTRLWFDGFVRFELGPLNSVFVGYILLLPTLALLIFLRLVLRSRGVYRGQAFLLLTGNALPLSAYLLQRAGINPVAPLDPTVLMLNVTGLLFTLAIYRFGMLGVIPVGRDAAFEGMPSAVLILDAENNIVDFNPAAGQLLALAAGTIGHPAQQRLAAFPDLLRLLEQQAPENTEITGDAAGGSRCFQVEVSPLNDGRGFKLGRLIWLRDVTAQKRLRELELRQQRTQAMVEERERLARELHDSAGQVLAYVSMQAQAIRKYVHDGQGAVAEEQLTRLAETARESHTDIRESILSLKAGAGQEWRFFVVLQQYLDTFADHYGIRTELVIPAGLSEEAFEPDAGLQLLRVTQEALTNVRKHAQARRVEVRLEQQDGHLQIVVADDGCGFDPDRSIDGEHDHFGLTFMRERLAVIGGALAVHSQPGAGTQVVLTVPLRAA